MLGHRFDLKLWINERYFGTTFFDNIWDLMNMTNDIEKLQKNQESVKIEFEIYLLTPNPWMYLYKEQIQTNDVEQCISNEDLLRQYNHFKSYFNANIKNIYRKQAIEFLKTHGIKNLELLEEID